MSCLNETPLETLPNGQKIWARNAKGEPVCNSLLQNREGKRCQRRVGLGPNGRCYFHNGFAASGILSPNFVNGRQSRYRDILPENLRADWDLLEKDPNWASLKDDILLTQTRLRKLLQDNPISRDLYRDLISLKDSAQVLLDGEYDEEDCEREFRRVIGLLDEIQKQYEAEREIERTQEHLRKLTETENKRMQTEIEQIPAPRAMLLFTTIMLSFKQHVGRLREFLKEEYPEVMKHPKYPNVLRLVAQDVNNLIPANVPGFQSDVIEVKATVKELDGS